MSDIEYRQYIVGPIQTNCYVVVCDGHAMVVDPGYSGTYLADVLSDVCVDIIVCTHGHFDHAGGVAALKAATGAQFAMAAEDLQMAQSISKGSDFGVPTEDDAPDPDIVLEDGDMVGVGEARFNVIAAPGHTPGGIVLLGTGPCEGIAFVGDTLFAGSAGRTDLEGGDYATLVQTLAHLKEVIPANTQLLCGHGPTTFMDTELKTNPFLQ